MFFRQRKSGTEGSVGDGASDPQIASPEAVKRSADDPEIASLGGLLKNPQPAVSVERGWSSLAEINAAIENETVVLEHVILARYLSQDPHNPDAYDYASRIGPLVSLYTRDWSITERHFCAYIPAAVVLRRRPLSGLRTRTLRKSKTYWPLLIDVVYLPEASRTTDPEVEAGLWKARSYYLDARQCRSLPRRDSLVRDIFSLMVNLLSLADAEAMQGYKHDRAAQARAKIDGELGRIKAEISRALLIEARHLYLAGMFAGAVALGGGVALINYIVSILSQVEIDTLGLGVIIAGGVGAVLSVMTRLTANNLRVDPDVGPRLVLLAGSFRPLIGGIFAFAVYIFVQGGLIPIKVTATGLQATYFYLGVAFLAGFSERFAQDAVTRAGSIIADTGPPDGSGGPAKESKQ